ncbi:hypothetical protein GH733_006222 [Mirounga leonina]|nr:hypothetical protein GH733_006222 [Mirounga leonina]
MGRKSFNMDPRRGSSSWWRRNFSRARQFPVPGQGPEQDSHGAFTIPTSGQARPGAIWGHEPRHQRGWDLPEELLRNLYDSIWNEPFNIPEDDGNGLTHTFFNLGQEDWLLKLGGGQVKNMRDKELGGIIPVENLNIQDLDEPWKPNCFELCISSNMGQLIKVCKMKADGRRCGKEKWIQSILEAVSIGPFCDMLNRLLGTGGWGRDPSRFGGGHVDEDRLERHSPRDWFRGNQRRQLILISRG